MSINFCTCNTKSARVSQSLTDTPRIGKMQEGEVWAPDATHGFTKGTVVEIGSETLTIQTPDDAVS